MRDQLFALDRQTTRDLKTACSGGTSDACTAQQQQVRDAYASILRADVTQNLPLGYGTYAADTRSQADSTFSMTDRTLGTVQGLVSGVVGALAPFGNALGTAAAAVTSNTAAQADIQNFVSGTVDAVGKGLGMGAAAAMGNDMAQADLSQAYTSTKAAANNALQQHNNQLADAYQNGDAQTIGQINGTIAGTILLAIPGGIVGTTGKAADVANALRSADKATAVVDATVVAKGGAAGVFDTGANITPMSTANTYRTIGAKGTFVTPLSNIESITGPISSTTTQITISKIQAAALESSLGLTPGSLESSNILSIVNGVPLRAPASPLNGNSLFRGGGSGLPGGGAELVIDSISSAGGQGIRQIIVKVK